MTEGPRPPASLVHRLLRPRTRPGVDAVEPRAIALSVPERVDEEALAAAEDPVAFKRRFGFLWPIEDRKRLLFLQSDHGLSDGQVRRLHAANALEPHPEEGLRFLARRWQAALGWAHLLVLALVFAPLFILGLLAHGSRLSVLQWTGLGLVATSVVAIGWAYYAFYVAPWRLRVRIERERNEPCDGEIDP